MREAQEHLPLIHAAEKAAEAGNHASAEDLLREAARLQEANLGPRHPDLANTLNNLGIICEVTGKPEDAEQYFRRAVSIARTSLPPDDPFVAISQKNLRDFCDARGKKVELPAPVADPPKAVRPAEPPKAARAAEPPKPAPVPELPEPAQKVTVPVEEHPQLSPERLFRRVALGFLGPIAMLMVVLAAGLPRLGAPELAAPASEAPRDATPPAAPAPPDPPDPAAPVEDIPEAATSDNTPASTTGRLVVVRASLCGDLDEWSCDPADRPVPPGPLFFYTQLTSTSATTVDHRWYHDDQLRQSVTLHVEANRAGYRTYSRRNLMQSDTAGSWRIELVSEDGTVLHEERFTVR